MPQLLLAALMGILALLELGQPITQRENNWLSAPTSRIVLASMLIVVAGSILVAIAARVSRVIQGHKDQKLQAERLHASALEQLSQMANERTRLLAEQDHHDVLSKACELSARRLESLFQALPIAAIGFDSVGTIYESNKQTELYVGISAQNLLYRGIDEFISPEQSSLLRRMLRVVFRGGSYYRVPFTFLDPSGTSRSVLITAFPQPGADQQIAAGLAVLEFVNNQEGKTVKKRLRKAA